MIGISLMLYDLARLTGTFDGEQPESNLDLIDMSLTGRARGPLVNFIVREMACCYGDVDRVRFEEVNKIRERALDLLKEGSLLEETCKNIEENKGHCYRASSGEEVARIVGDLVGEGKTVVKSFSWTVEESKLGERRRESNVVLDTAFPKALSHLRVDNGDLRNLIESMGVRIGEGDVLASLGALYRDA
ncbi:MAG: LUD domain-containing protein, partial [Candidatus Korarchaeota archaeon]|nr:LUD domain-containing protein [Candidatus Korarchaeota archaeon]